ncbi:ribosome maturation factor RimP [Companilactobacillus mishanensis]|uniref:Ribosome maturation factor RimP n=1 Tax=Companilactobacillus mishanensis TaxID=2486008 RepID=A0A5P0ZEP4_9LACO|nr:ribosome maturation factor RimP [Companilactobacillus mishanensis]MQS44382.1 ribosome maturation factor RimP [Companilactobacillus mishanensis]MQS51516.1 ribosome maturation factor RimP [Companilactobacillus mishanensis]
MNNKIDELKDILQPILEKHDFFLVDLEFVHERGDWYLRVYADKKGGITIDDCALISEEYGEKLDELDPIDPAYYLEVSSPGAERPIKNDEDLSNYEGDYVNVSLYQKIDGSKAFEGTLTEVTDDEIKLTIKVKNLKKQVNITRDKIAKIRLAIEF